VLQGVMHPLLHHALPKGRQQGRDGWRRFSQQGLLLGSPAIVSQGACQHLGR